MKTKNRLLLTSAMMLALVAVSGTTATYAWFTNSLSDAAGISNITTNVDSSLDVTYASADTTSLGVTGKTFDIKKNLTDVTSADGKAFKKMKFESDGQTAKELYDITASTYSTAASAYYYEFTATVKMSSITAGRTYSIFVSDSKDSTQKMITPVTATNDNVEDKTAQQAKNNALAAATRVSVTGNLADHTGTTIFANNASPVYQDTKSTTAGITSAKTKDATASLTEFDKADSTAKADATYFGDLTNETTSFILTFRIWLEGAATTNDAIDGQVNYSFYIYAIATDAANA